MLLGARNSSEKGCLTAFDSVFPPGTSSNTGLVMFSVIFSRVYGPLATTPLRLIFTFVVFSTFLFL